MTRRPELDLARALAVSAVLVGHAGYEAGLVPLAAEALWRAVDRYAAGDVAGPVMHQPSASVSPRSSQPEASGTA